MAPDQTIITEESRTSDLKYRSDGQRHVWSSIAISVTSEEKKPKKRKLVDKSFI